MPISFRRHVPNAVTVLRLVLAGAFFLTLNLYRYPDVAIAWANLAIGVFILAALTDTLDGWLARRWDAVSRFGRIMDPFCDKVLILGSFIYLAGPRFVVPEWVQEDRFLTMATGIYPWMVVVILARELLVTSLRGLIESGGVSFAATASGKWKMIVQSVCIPTLLFLVVNFEPGRAENAWARWTGDGLVYFTLLVTVWSGVPYVLRARSVFLNARSEA